SLLPARRRRLAIDVSDIRAVNESIIYVRASGYGPRGPDADTGGFDVAAAWGRPGVAAVLSAPDASQPTPPPRRIGDCVGGLSGGAGVAAALFKRARTGTPSEVDISLLHGGLWMGATILMWEANSGGEGLRKPTGGRRALPNPLTNSYKTRDGRWLWLAVLQPDPKWRSFCEHVGHPELFEDPRFVDFQARRKHTTELTDIRDGVFASRPLDEGGERLRTLDGVWDPNQPLEEVVGDPRAPPNGSFAGGGEPGPPLSVVT